MLISGSFYKSEKCVFNWSYKTDAHDPLPGPRDLAQEWGALLGSVSHHLA